MAKKEANVKKENNKVKKHFFKDMKAELKKVIWPTQKQLVNNTIAVVTIVLIIVAIVFVLDSIFDIVNQYGITNLQGYVVEHFVKDEKKDDNSNNEENKQEENSENNEEQSSENSTQNEQTTQTESNE